MKIKPRLLDLFCGAGGAAMGYYRAGFEVVGVDIKPQPHYPFNFVLGDALDQLEAMLEGCLMRDGLGNDYYIYDFDAIHASPPCQLWAQGHNLYRNNYPDLIKPIRIILKRNGKPYVIENVPRAPLRKDLIICGCQLGLKHIRRKRVFEMNFPAPNGLPKQHDHSSMSISVTGTGTPTGTWLAWGRALKLHEFQEAMGIDWMARKELSEAIPPAYTEYIGNYLMEVVMKNKKPELKEAEFESLLAFNSR